MIPAATVNRAATIKKTKATTTAVLTLTPRALTNMNQIPVMTAMSTATDASESQLQTRAQLTGAVEVNFKSDDLPLIRWPPRMIAAIQGNSTPVDPNVVPSAVNRPPTTTMRRRQFRRRIEFAQNVTIRNCHERPSQLDYPGIDRRSASASANCSRRYPRFMRCRPKSSACWRANMVKIMSYIGDPNGITQSLPDMLAAKANGVAPLAQTQADAVDATKQALSKSPGAVGKDFKAGAASTRPSSTPRVNGGRLAAPRRGGR